MKSLSDSQSTVQSFRWAIPPAPIQSVCEWGREHVKLIGSARSENYDPEITPWAKKPTECTDDGVSKIVSFVKPVQSGGSAASEVAVCRRLSKRIGGDLQWNWESDEKALDRWDKRIERILKACQPVSEIMRALDRFKAKKCLVVFPHCNLTVQGQHTSSNLDSDSIAFQVNEELHNWEPGHLEKADGRLTAVWNGFQLNISNASFAGDQFHQKFSRGTQEHWEVLCPHCSTQATPRFHPMRTRWDDKRPDLGGLRYDSTGCKIGSEYNYNKMEGTIRFQMPCGGEVRDDRDLRRRMSIGGDYGAPRNVGAKMTDRSFTLEAVAVDYIPWLLLIQEKHAALRAMQLGDPEPWWRYLRERECVFADKGEDRPMVGAIILNTKIKKNREGLKNRVARFAACDRQRGRLTHGETAHWWMVIRDFDSDGNSLLVWEGKLDTDDQVVDVLKQHGVAPTCVVADSGDGATTSQVYSFCLHHGFSAIKGSPEALFPHKDGGRRIFSQEKPLHLMVNAPPTQDDPQEEPLFWFYSKAGIRERLHWLRGSDTIRFDTPGDVSEDYKKHMEAEEVKERKHPRTGETITEFVQVRKRNDLLVCEAYCCMLAEIAGIIGAPIATKSEVKEYQLK